MPADSTELFTVTTAGNRVNIYNVPIFQAHSDRGYECDEQWLDRCVADFWAQKAESVRHYGANQSHAMCPPITFGHTPENPNDPEPKAVGYVDNLRRLGDTLYADLMDIQAEDWLEIQKNRYPYRSAEIIPHRHRLTNLSLLGGRYPHFPLPVMRFTAMVDGEEVPVLRYSIRGSLMPAIRTRSNDSANVQRHAFGQPGDTGTAVGAGGAGTTVAGQINVDDLVNKVAAAVMAKMGEQQANAGGGPPAAAYTTRERIQRNAEAAQVTAGMDDEDGKTKTEAEEGSAGMNPPKPEKNAAREPVQRHKGPTAAGKAAMWAQVDDAGGRDENDEEYEKGTMEGNWHTKQAADVKGLQRHNDELRKQVESLTKTVNELQRHNADTAVATKRTLLSQKFQTLVASGHAIGDKAAIDRHVARCMKFTTDEIEGYIADLKSASPAVKVGGQRYSTEDGVLRDPSGVQGHTGVDAETAQRYGLDDDVLKLADSLADM